MSDVDQDNPGETVPRLLPDEPLPPYSYVPGRFPHPESDPAGHSFDIPRPVPVPLSPLDWHTSRSYLRGLDLFNAGYYWESHVEFEGLWLACGRSGATADFAKGLIKLAAAGVKQLEGRLDGVRSHAARAADLWRSVSQSPEANGEFFLGFRLRELVELADLIARAGWPARAPVLRLAVAP